MGPSGEKLIELTYQIYSKTHNISFEKFVNDVIMNENKTVEFNNLWEEAKEIYFNRKK